MKSVGAKTPPTPPAVVVNVVANTFIRMMPITAKTNSHSWPISFSSGELLKTEIHSPCRRSLMLL